MPSTTPPPRCPTTPSKANSFTPGARKTAMHRLPVHLPLSFEEEGEDGEQAPAAPALTIAAPADEPPQQHLPPPPGLVTTLPSAASPSTRQMFSPRAWSPSFRPPTPTEKGFHLDPHDLSFQGPLAQGAYGVVWRGQLQRRPRSGTAEIKQDVAIKVQRVPKDEQEQANLLIELSVLRGLIHPRLVRYYGAALLSEDEVRASPEWRPLLDEVPCGLLGDNGEKAVGITIAKEEDGEEGAQTMLVLIAMELCVRGSLRRAMQQHRSALPWGIKIRLTCDVAEGLAFLHAHGLLHRDLKTTNVLLDGRWRAMICDYAFVAAAGSPDLGLFNCGTVEFQSPEQALCEPYDAKCDVFSLGVLVCELVTGQPPGQQGFLCRTGEDLFALRGEEVEERLLPGCPPSFLALGLQCAAQEPEDRPTAIEALEWAQSLLGELQAEGDAALFLPPPDVEEGNGEGGGEGKEEKPGAGAGGEEPQAKPKEEEGRGEGGGNPPDDHKSRGGHGKEKNTTRQHPHKKQQQAQPQSKQQPMQKPQQQQQKQQQQQQPKPKAQQQQPSPSNPTTTTTTNDDTDHKQPTATGHGKGRRNRNRRGRQKHNNNANATHPPSLGKASFSISSLSEATLSGMQDLKIEAPTPTTTPPKVPLPKKEEQEEAEEEGEEDKTIWDQEDLLRTLACCVESWDEQTKRVFGQYLANRKELKRFVEEGKKEGKVDRADLKEKMVVMERMMREDVLPLTIMMAESMGEMIKRL